MPSSPAGWMRKLRHTATSGRARRLAPACLAHQLPPFSSALVWGPYMLRMCLEMGDPQEGAPCVLNLACSLFSGWAHAQWWGRAWGTPTATVTPGRGVRAGAVAEPWAEFVP